MGLDIVRLLMESAKLFGMNKILLVLVFGLIMFGFVSGAGQHVKVDKNLFKNFDKLQDQNNGKVRVLIKLKNNSEVLNYGFGIFSSKKGIPEKINIDKSNINKGIKGYISAYVSKDDLEGLKTNEFIESVGVEQFYHTLLQDSVNIMNFSPAWNLEKNNLNLTGTGQTVCIIDTGVNYSHIDFGGCYGNDNVSSNCTILGGWDFCGNDGDCAIEDGDPMDVEGHGTHVSGIVAANGGIKGTAPNTKIVMMKAANASGDFFTVNLIGAIDWCVANASKFNISVISMSLGGGQYSGYCDSDGASNAAIANSINAAVANNISVTVATGNDGWDNYTSSPACIQSVTRVGATGKDDSITSYSNRNSITKLFATGGAVGGSGSCSPGSMDPNRICSTSQDGAYIAFSGTSMATPMVAGAIAIIRQYLGLSGQTKTPSEIENALYHTGLQFNESSNNFSRIDVYSALLFLDADSPNVTLISPADNHVNLSTNQSFSCNATDWQLANVTFRIWNSSGLYYNESRNLTGIENGTTFEILNMSEDAYDWNCFFMDDKSNLGTASANFSLTIGGVEVNLESPANDSYTNTNETNFSCGARSDASYELTNMSFNLWNSSGFLVSNQTLNISGIENSTNFNYTFLSEDTYLWECIALNNNSDEGDGVNFSISYDNTTPVISDSGASKSTTSAVISWTTNESANSSIWVSGGSWSNSSSYTTSHSISISSLSASTNYNYILWSCDKASNCVNDSGNFTTNNVVVSSGGGGGSSGGPTIYSVKDDELREGVTKVMAKNDKARFVLASGSHELSVSKVGEDFAEIILRSDPIAVNLSIGEEKKFNLSSSEYYDLFVRLNGINRGHANFTIMRIFESISKEDEVILHITEDENKTEYKPTEITSEDGSNFWIGLLILVLIVVFFYAKNFKHRRIKKKDSSA